MAAVVLLALFCTASLKAQEDKEQSREQALVTLANQARSDAGLKALTWDPALAAAAKAHAERMAQEGELSHRYGGEQDLAQRASGAGAHFSMIEENIAVGDTPFHVHQGWMKSQAHHDNLLNAKIDRIGVAIIPVRGTLYVVADYAAGVAQTSSQDIESGIGKLLESKGLKLKTDGAADARIYCASDEQTSQRKIYARFLMRWQSSDVTKLPPQLEQRIASGVYQEAAVGSCPAQGENGAPVFSGYRIAVLLY
ncbi:MAG TPA: CAP domain-containing protein [Acidobacteriaceae bacterium]|nr:CAP domain-containing protein [Acidobacteriaceae bacterium]